MEITSVNNARVKEWAQLLEKKHRDKRHQYIVEGVHLVMEALKARADIEAVAYDLESGIPAELRSLANEGSADVEWIGVTPAIIAKCTDTVTPQPVFAIIHKRPAEPASLWAQKEAMVMVLDGVQDPGNVGTIIRSADAAGAAGVVLGKGCADVYNPKTIRSTMGSLFHLPIVEGDLSELLPQARANGARIVSTSLQAQDTCYTYSFAGQCWLLVGNEARGVSKQVQELVDDTIIIPMQGQAESLNVAMASTVLLFEAMRQRGV